MPHARKLFSVCLAAAALLCCSASLTQAEVRLPSVFDNHMVLQRNAEIPVWGWASPGEEVTVEFNGEKETTQADDEGRWQVRLEEKKAGGPHQMKITGKNKITLKNILVGEVWVCSGQSNMEWPLTRANNPKEEIATAKYPRIRLFDVPRTPAGTPQEDVEAEWQPCSPKTVPSFSAVGYFFGRHLHKELDVPVGLISTNWGGTRIEPWTPVAGFKSVPEVKGILKVIEEGKEKHSRATLAALDQFENWVSKARKAAKEKRPLPEMPGLPGHPLANRGAPTGLYNGMVHPLVPFAMRGAIWYQGEANRNDGMLYHYKMKALINGWREVWGQGEFPFLYVQLAPYRYGRNNPQDLPQIWEAQLETLSVPNTGMAVTTDIGNVKDIHPRNKQDVGKRLSLWALAKTYGRDGIVYSGPLYKSMAVEDNRIRLRFDHVGNGLKTNDGKPLSHFTIAGKDRKFVPAEAKINGETVVVWSDKVEKPVAVRFGWHEEAEPNLVNKQGLPASPFRTDDWKIEEK